MNYVVGTKVKELLKQQGCMTAGDFVDELNSQVEGLVKRAAARAKSNGRKTARAGDL